MKISFCLHNHQPVGNFLHIMEAAYSNCYLPMLEVLESHGEVKIGFHISGTLLEWLEQYHPEYLEKISVLCRKGQMELLTSGRYEPVLPVFRREDIIEQISSYSDHLKKLSGTRPEGLWLTERVWEPQLPSILSEAAISYAVVDDIHLQRAGIHGMNLFQPCLTEDSGRTVRLLGSNHRLRYGIPFSPVKDVIAELKQLDSSGADLVFYGDDGEKFGVWPGTNELCFGNGWLNNFFDEVESASWLETVLPSLAANIDPVGPVYVPAASYTEMGEWTLSDEDRDRFEEAREILYRNTERVITDFLLSGGFWRNFFSIYPESKELHGRILSAEATVRRSGNLEALHHFWRSQCNCSFWHGVFGGIYLPHLREAVWKELHSAERIALRETDSYPFVCNNDIDADGKEETVIVTEHQSLLVHPGKGLTVSEFSYIPLNSEPVPMGHVLSRRHEKYHEDIPGVMNTGEVKTIHDDLPAMEEGLAGKIVIDRWRRVCFSDLVMQPDITFEDWKRCDAGIIDFQKSASSHSSDQSDRTVHFNGTYKKNGLEVRKNMRIDLTDTNIEVFSEYSVNPGDRTGMEICLNLMTGSSADRFFRVDSGGNRLMGEDGTIEGKRIDIIDRWRNVMVLVDIDTVADIWFAPIESVNRSERGYERVHQGAALYISGHADSEGHYRLHLRIETKSLN